MGEPEKRIVDEPTDRIREVARKALKGRMPLAIASGIIYMLCLSIPVIIVEQITGLWDVLERATNDYIDAMANGSTPEMIYELVQSYQGQWNISIATFLFLLLVPGPLTLGVNTVWLRVIRGHEAFADMVLSGFGNFFRAILLHFFRSALMALWAVFFIVPGIMTYYRYNLVFFLLADNPDMSPFTALNLSKYYMRGNRAGRFSLDMSFIGWFLLAAAVLFLANCIVIYIVENTGAGSIIFTEQLVTSILFAIIFAPLGAYRGVSAADYYHRVICKAPDSFNDALKFSNT